MTPTNMHPSLRAWSDQQTAHIITAWCYTDGIIRFDRRTPDGGMRLLRGDETAVRAAVAPIARLAHDGETLLVPGVPEAETRKQALDAVLRFKDWAKKRMEGTLA